MPNWCTNILTVSGHEELLKEFVDSWKPSIMQTLVPMPDDVDQQLDEAKGGELFKWITTSETLSHVNKPETIREEAWYYWRCTNWGTKWDLGEDDIHILIEDPDHIVVEFDTAWSPVVPFVKSISRNFPLLSFRLQYYELGNFFAGEHLYERGLAVEDEEGLPSDFGFCADIVEQMTEDDEEFRQVVLKKEFEIPDEPGAEESE